MPSFAIRSTKAILNLITKMIKADVRMHNAEAFEKDTSVIFTVNHFTRLETLLLPYEIWRHTGVEPWSLAAGDLFRGKVGDFLSAVGSISTKDPDRDKIIISSLLKGDHPWVIFPEGAMIKDKKLIDAEGQFRIFDTRSKSRRAPHTGAATLALRTEFYRQKLACLAERPGQPGLQEVLDRFDLDSYEQVAERKTAIIPVNITYFPIRARKNLLYNLATGLAKNLSQRALEELSVESTILAKDSDVDITLGEPIDAREYLEQPGFEELLVCGDSDFEAFEENPRSLFNDVARDMMNRYMGEIYELATINFDHIFANVIRHQTAQSFTERAYRNRIFLSAHEILKQGKRRVHGALRKYYRDILYEDPNRWFQDFTQLCIKENWIELEGEQYAKNFKLKRGVSEFHDVRKRELSYVIANEIEPMSDVLDIIKKYAVAPRRKISKMIHDLMIEEDNRIFNEDYEKHAHKRRSPKSAEIARPFLLKPTRIKAGIVLVHGYLAAPLEIYELAEYLYEQGYAVYGVRLKGHGTAPEDLAETPWEAWYESVNRGYAVIKTLTDDIILGGFSTGGALALLAAARKKDKIQAVFSINAPLQLRDYAVHLIPSLHVVNLILNRFQRSVPEWKYVANDPEHEHINYQRNPVSAIKQLGEVMGVMENSLSEIVAPTLILQGSRDPVVDPSSAQLIFHQVGTSDKEMVMLERDRHGVVLGEDSEDVFERVVQFLEWAERKQAKPIKVTPEVTARIA